jgi:hypothetical protein
MIVFVRAFTATHDARINKYFQSLERRGETYRFIGWDRLESSTEYTGSTDIYRSITPLGRKWRNIFRFMGWQLFILNRLVRSRKETNTVHCIDLDSAIASYTFCLLFRKNFVLDLYDNFSSSRGINGKIGNLLDRVETLIAKVASLTIVAAPERIEQHGLDPASENLLVLENVPADLIMPLPLGDNFEPLRIGYFGVLEKTHRGIEHLVELARVSSNVEVHVAGYGPLETMIQQAADVLPNLFFYGSQGSQDGLAIMQNMHVIAGFYYLSNANHMYAAPNKYYEHLVLGRGMLTTTATPPGKRVKVHRTGWAIDEGFVPLRSWVENVASSNIIEAATNARRLWDSRYSDYFERMYIEEYGRRIINL